MNNAFLVSSSGGHFSELKKLNIENYNCIYIVEVNNNDDSIINHKLKYGTRSKLISYIFISIYNTIKAIFLFCKYRPKLLISTGAHTCVVFFYVARLFKCKTVYIESFAKVNNSSMTYNIIKNKCDLVIVQHEEMLDVYNNSKFIGGVY